MSIHAVTPEKSPTKAETTPKATEKDPQAKEKDEGCEKAHVAEAYRLEDDDDACYDSVG